MIYNHYFSLLDKDGTHIVSLPCTAKIDSDGYIHDSFWKGRPPPWCYQIIEVIQKTEEKEIYSRRDEKCQQK